MQPVVLEEGSGRSFTGIKVDGGQPNAVHNICSSICKHLQRTIRIGFTMRFTIVLLVVLLAGVTLTSAKPLILTKKFLRYVLPTITAKVAGLSGLSGLTGLTGLTGLGSTHRGLGGSVGGGKTVEKVGSVYLPNRVYSFMFPKDSFNPPPSVVYHSLEDYCVPDPYAVPPPPPPAPVPVPLAGVYPSPVVYPAPLALPPPVAYPPPVVVGPLPPPPVALATASSSAQGWDETNVQTTVNVNDRQSGPNVYVAETPSARHEASLPGYTGSVVSSNTAPAPGTTQF